MQKAGSHANLRLSIEVDDPKSTDINDTFESTDSSPSFISGGFKLTSSGVDAIPEKRKIPHSLPFHRYPSREPNQKKEEILHDPIKFVVKGHPKYTNETLIIIDQIGTGSSSRVFKCMHVPTLSLVAVS
jgi:hypothetical protein